MNKKITGLLGAAAALVISAPSSYAELLSPIPNATELLKADQAANVRQAAWFWDGYQWQWREPIPAPDEYPYYRYHHHHHHHHHHHYRDYDHDRG